MAEGTPLELKRQVAGDVVTLGVEGDAGRGRWRCCRPSPTCARRRRRTATLRLYVDHGEAALPQLLRLLDGAGRPPTTISLHRPSLDDVFLRQTGRSLREEAA